MFRRRPTVTTEIAETRTDIVAAYNRHAKELAVGALSALTPNVA